MLRGQFPVEELFAGTVPEVEIREYHLHFWNFSCVLKG